MLLPDADTAVDLHFEILDALGANILATKGFLIRPELRWDWSNTIVNGVQRPFVDFSKDSQITLSFDIIHEF